MGKVIKAGIERKLWSREDLVISTKLFFGTKSGPNDVGYSRKHLIEGKKASLKRFKLTMAFYWGTSEWCANDILQACEIANRLGLIRSVFEQPQYHILERSRVEYDFNVLYKKYNYGLTMWSPLASVLLSDDLEEKIAKADELADVAKEVGCSVAQLSIVWVAANPHVSTVILGATSVKQLDENLKAMDFVDKITPEVRKKIDAIADYQPKFIPQAESHVINLRRKWL
ncbi:unnamed protein product [Peronospora belbahrii]|uniref:NADP-dependent oxidoreductase domain-containing protein n=1 Tax=Peronospora belbahrii TaxID=622444 RepID=A0ABN8D0J1_9STRA|nr:unnamed protein product [Peronospora belbahrii]